MDGLDRSIKAIDTTHVCRTRQEYRRQDRGMDFKLAAYIAHPKIGMRSAKTSFPYVILLPNELGWTSKEMRSLADELSFQCQFPVIVPNIYRSKSAKEVLDKGVRHEQVLDDLIAVVNFMMNTYGYDIFSLAGVGIGGGLALECSADLHAVSLLAITEGLASEIALSTQEIFNNATAQEALVQSAVSKMMIPRYNPFLRRRRYYEGALEVKINLNETGLSIPKEEKQDGKKDEAMVEFLEVLSGEELVELKREEQDKAKMEAEDRDKKDDVIFSDFKVPIKATETEKVEKEEVKEEVKEKDVVPADPLSSEMTSDEVGDFAKVLSSDADLDIMMEEAIKDIAGDYAGDYNTTGTDEEDEEKKEEESLEEKRARAKLGKQHYFEDWELILKLTKRIQSFTPQNTDEYFDDENQVERGLVSEDCSVPMQKLINLAPRSCLAFAPNRFDTQKVSQYLTLPTMIMSTSQETVQHGTLNAIRDLHRSFVLRREEMADFMFRIYNQQSSSFLLSPQDDANRRALMVSYSFQYLIACFIHYCFFSLLSIGRIDSRCSVAVVFQHPQQSGTSQHSGTD